MSPLGKYSQIVAALTAILIIIVHLGLVAFLNNQSLHDAFQFVLGAVFGASATTALTNGTVKRDLDALHKRVDAVAPPAPIAEEILNTDNG